MRLPREIRISGYTLKIEYKKKIFVNGNECFGVYNPENKTVSLVKGMSPTRKKEIFLHEYIHFLEDIYRIDIAEDEVSSLALGILQIINHPKIDWKSK